MQVGIYGLAGGMRDFRTGRHFWTLEHRKMLLGLIKPAFEGICTRFWKVFAAIGVRTFANLQDWELERTETVLSASRDMRQSRLSISNRQCTIRVRRWLIDDDSGKIGERRKKVCSLGVSSEPLPMAVPDSLHGDGAVGHDLRIASPKGTSSTTI